MKKKGFTLVELLAVIAILSVLVILAMPNVLKLFNEAKIKSNLITAENYVNAGEQYYAKTMGENDDFNGITNVAKDLKIDGRKPESEKVFINKKGEVSVYLVIDGDCYYKTAGSQRAQHTTNVGLCVSTMFMAGTPVIINDTGDGLYYDEDDNKLVYKSDEGQIGAKVNKTYCSYDLIDRNGTKDCNNKDIRENTKYSELSHYEDNVNNWIYFNCENETDSATCEKWRIVRYDYLDNNHSSGELLLISPDILNVHYDEDSLHIATNKINSKFSELYYTDYLSGTAKSLIKEDTYFIGNVSRKEDVTEILFPNNIVQKYYSWNIDGAYDEEYTGYWGYLNPVEYFESSTTDICYLGQEHYEDYSSYDIDEIPFTECNSWLNDGSFFMLSSDLFVGELGTISSNFPGSNGIRPVVKLNSTAQIISGDGSSSSPYMLRYGESQDSLTSKEMFIANVKKLYEEAQKSSMQTLYSESLDKYKLPGFEDSLEYVIQKENGNVVSIIAKDKLTGIYKIEIGGDFNDISENDIIEYAKEREYTNDKLLGLDSVHSWDKKCTGKNTLNCKIVQSTNKNIIKSNEYTDENNDGLGTRIYYYTENPSNIFVKFAGYCWKIVRTNENGSTKLLYSGEYSANECIKMTTGITGGTLAFNTDKTYAQHVGYMYNPAYSSNYVTSHQNITSSNIKTKIDAWYEDKIKSQGNAVTSKIANTVYCNDRSVNNQNNSGYGMLSTTYAISPGYKCLNQNDQFTLSASNGGENGYGNNALTYPIALLTKAEASYSGIGTYAASNKYLGNGVWNYWTMTPNVYKSGGTYYGAANKIVSHNYTTEKVSISDNYVTVNKAYVLPAISLKSDVTVSSGNGTASSPYVIK